MAIPEKISEALTQTELSMKSFRKAMLVVLFEWQNLETRLDSTEKMFQENYPSFQIQESESSKGVQESGELGLGSMRLGIERRLSEVEEKERVFRVFRENGFREMEVREERLGALRREVELREKKVVEKEGVVEMERKLIGEKERENLCKEEELRERVREFELKERDLEMMKKDLELREKEWDSKEKGSSGAAVFRIAGPSNHSMALVNVSGASSGKQSSKGRLRSKAWQHFTKIEKGEGAADKCKCNYCSRIFTLCGGGTSQLLRHISEGRCPAYLKQALPIDEMLSQTHSPQSVEVHIQESFIRPSNVGEGTRAPLIKRSEENVKQEPATALLEPELPHMEQQMAVHNITISEYNYQPQQPKDLSKDESGPSSDQQPHGMENYGISPPLGGCSVSLDNNENIHGVGDSDRYCQESQLGHKENSDLDENASGNSSEELQMFTSDVDIDDQRSPNRKRERDHIIEQNESNNVFLHSDIDDLSSPLRKHCSRKLSTDADENTEHVLHEVDPVSCIMPIDPAQELYGHMMNQKDLTHEGSLPG